MNKIPMRMLLALTTCVLLGTVDVSAEDAHMERPSRPRVYRLWDDVPAEDWSSQAYKLGNGYMGATVFGGTDTERIQITEKTLYNTGGGKYGRGDYFIQNHGSMTNFAEVYLDIGHSHPVNYERCLNLNEAIHYVHYEHDGVRYSREYFMSYPDNVMVVKLHADLPGKISFTLRPEIPYLREPGRPHTRTGEVIAQNDLVRLHGSIKAFSLNYEAQIKVLNRGGTLSSNQDGDIAVSGADSVVVILATGTNYELCKNVFLTPDNSKKLDASVYPQQKVSDRIASAARKGFETLRGEHLADYQSLFSRVRINLASEVTLVPTKTLLSQYPSGEAGRYLEELFAQYGRYLLISSSRKGTLPVGIFGIWRESEVSQFSAGYWHNANLQANYWGAMSANLAETFIPYSEYWQAYYPAARRVASNHLNRYRELREGASSNPDGNGWTVGTGATVYHVGGPGAHSGPGTGGLTSKMLWDYWDFTRDKNYLENVAYPCLLGLSKFNSRTLRPDPRNPEVLLVSGFSASPEIQVLRGGRKVNANTSAVGVIGCTFDQGLAWENYSDTLKAAEILGDNDPFLKTIQEEIGRLDPILIGSDGQVKEFREEDGYSDIGFDPRHRHIAHLHTLHPGTLINSTTPQWLKAADKTLDVRGNDTDMRRGPGKRGNGFMGWSTSCRVNMRARTKNGAMAYEAYSKWLKRNAHRQNLQDGTHDGNLGLMSGVVEMLIQSHEGCIEPLPALPDQWSIGKFEGLMARGNFEVSAKWNNKTVQLKIVSKSGGACRVKYPGIENIRISDVEGNAVSSANERDDLVEFMTTKNGQYFMDFTQMECNTLSECLDDGWQRAHDAEEGNAPISFTVSRDGSITDGPKKEGTLAHRKGTIIVEAKPGETIHIEQQAHEFGFGATLTSNAFNGRMSETDTRKYKEVFLENFNIAVTKNALKWRDMQPTPDKVNYSVVDAMLKWTDAHDIPLRGHNIYWGAYMWQRPWMKALSDGELRKALEVRGRDIGSRYKGRFVQYDFNNEMIWENFYVDRLGEGITMEMVNWVMSEDPGARLFVNDFNILTGVKLQLYVDHITDLLERGFPLAGIGVQGHLHGDSFDPVAVKNALDELAKFDLPIVVTEFNFPGQRSKYRRNRQRKMTEEEELYKAQAIADYYRICFEHPAVDGILMWGFWEKENWIPASSLYARDWTPRPALKAYRDLVFGQWWTDVTVKADSDGRVEIPAFYGEYLIKAGERVQELKLEKSIGSARIRVE